MPSGKKSREARKRKASVPKPPSSSRRSRPPARWLAAGGVLVLVAIGLGLGFGLTGGGSAGAGSAGGNVAPLSTLGKLVSPGPLGPAGPEGVPLETGAALAPAAAPAPGTAVDGISCEPGEQVLFHIHARLTIFVDGHPRRVPYGVGIANPQAEGTTNGAFVTAGKCFAWLHTHAADGIIHIESPVRRTYTLGNFFDIWHQPLSRTRVGPAAGHVTALVDGEVWTASPRAIPLKAHAEIQLEVGRPLVAPVRIPSWKGL